MKGHIAGVKLYPHQEEALCKLKNGSILRGQVGSGKSLVAIAYYVLREAHRDLYVITTAKKRDSLDWIMEAARYGVGEHPEASTAGVVRVDSWNNITKYQDIKDAFFIFDEQRAVGSGVWAKNFIKIAKNNRWILLSATPGDNWMDYVPVFIANGYYRNKTEFSREHIIYSAFTHYQKVDRYVGQGKLLRIKREIQVEMPFQTPVLRTTIRVKVPHDQALMRRVLKERWNPYEERPIQDAAELFRVMRKLVNSDPSRVDAIRTILHEHPKLIVFYNFDYELELLRKLSDVTTVAEWNGHKHEPIPTETDKWVYLVQYTAGAEGWNCTDTPALLLYSQTYSYKTKVQAKGRIDRLNVPFLKLFYYELLSDAKIDRAIEASLRAKKDFNEKGTKIDFKSGTKMAKTENF